MPQYKIWDYQNEQWADENEIITSHEEALEANIACGRSGQFVVQGINGTDDEWLNAHNPQIPALSAE